MKFFHQAKGSLGAFAFLMGFAVAESPEEKLALANVVSVQEPVASEPAEPVIPSPQISSKVKDLALRKHLMDNIDIFGKTEMPAIYILAPGIEEVEGFLLTRDFSRDEFFMQNIDREEFEMKTSLRDFEEGKKGRKKDEESR